MTRLVIRPLMDFCISGQCNCRICLSIRREADEARNPPEDPAFKITELGKYAALGRACEANGLAGFNEDGSHWFQPPKEVIEEQAVGKYIEDQERLAARYHP